MHIYRLPPIILQSVIYLVTRIFFSIFGRLEIRGIENIPKKLSSGVLFAANHSSEWDGPLIRSSLPFFSLKYSPMYYVAGVKRRYEDSGWRKHIYGGFLFLLLGAYPIYSGKKDYEYSLQNHIKILNNGRSLCIFPEGRCTQDGALAKAHGGVAFLAKHCKVIIIPVAIQGLVGFNFFKFIQFKNKVTVTFGKPVYINEVIHKENPSPKDYKYGADIIMKRIENLLGRQVKIS